MSLQKVKRIDQRSKDLVFGYVHQLNPELIIPEINYICLLYYYLIAERFILCTEKIKIFSSDENDEPKNDIFEWNNDCQNDDDQWTNIHGNVIINPSENPKAIITWTIKVLSKADTYIIGIHSIYEDSVGYGGDQAGYGWWGSSNTMIGTRSNYSYCKERFTFGDVIKLELNVANKEVTYYKNGEKINFVFENIDISSSYHLLLRVLKRDNVPKGQLIDFEIIGHESMSFYDESN